MSRGDSKAALISWEITSGFAPSHASLLYNLRFITKAGKPVDVSVKQQFFFADSRTLRIRLGSGALISLADRLFLRANVLKSIAGKQGRRKQPS